MTPNEDRYRMLLQIADLIAQHRSLAGLFQDLTRRLQSVVKFDYLNYLLCDADRNVMRSNIIDSESPERLPEIVDVPVDNSYGGQVWKTQQSITVDDDVAAENRFHPALAILQEYGVRSYCLMPLTTAQRRLGALGFGSKNENAYSKEDVEFLQHVAQQVAVAVDNVLNYQTIESYLEQVARRRAEDALKQSQVLFEQLFEASPYGVLVVDSDGLITRVNAQTEKMFGYPRSELIGKAVEILVPDRLRAAHVRSRHDYHDNPRMRTMDIGLELFAKRKDGSEFPAEIMLNPVETQDGPIVFTVVRDITRRKRAEDALRTSEQQIQSILDNSPTIIYVKDLEGRYIRANKRFESLYRIEGDQALGKTDYDLFPKEIAEILRANDQKVLEAASPLEFEEVKTHNGNSQTYISIKFPLFDSWGRPYAIAGISTDITERKKAEEALLLEFSTVLLSNLDVRELFNAISATLRRIMPHEFATLALYAPETKELRLWSLEQSETEPALQKEMLSPAQEALAGRVMNSRQPLVLNNLDGGRIDSRLANRLRAEGVKSACFLPLITQDRVLGTLNMVSRREAAFQQQHVDLLQQVGSRVAVALNNALTYRKVAELKERLAEEKLYLEEEIRTEFHFEEIIGESPALKRVLKQVESVGPTNATVLILGETGTGKELIARAIHDLSPRRDRTFVKLNCAAIPTGLLESELFGHEKGAFTGAITQKIGRLELADGGTLFLDEVGDIPLELQPKLLRALQEKEFERLGSTRTIPVDVRLIAATNRDLAKMVAERQFRSDLYYRLRVFPVTVPPLRDRGEDIPILARYFAQKHAERMHRPIEIIPPETMDALAKWRWPGNVRELENIIERAVILSPGPVLRVPLAELEMNPTESEDSNGNGAGTLEDAERDHIIRILRETRGIIGGPSGAAARLGLKRTTLNSKMRKLGITREEIAKEPLA